MQEITQIPTLNKSEFKTLKHVLSDFDTCVPGAWIIAGSISYRLCVRAVRTPPGLRDVDLVVFSTPGQDPKLLVSKDVRNAFYVMRISEPGAGYYYHLIHKKAGIHVDVFTKETQEHRMVTLGGLQVGVALAERTLFHGLVHLLMCDSKGLRIERKRPYIANKLWGVLDRNVVLSMFTKYPDEYQRYLSESLVGEPPVNIVKYALELKTTKATRERNLPKRPVTTVHGISIEDDLTLQRLSSVEKGETFWQQLQNKLYSLRMIVRI